MRFPRAGVDNCSVSGPRRAEKGNIMHKLGLKLFSSKGFYIQKASALYVEGVFQYIELYVEPGTVVGYLSAWKELDVPMALHAPRTLSGFNLSLKEKMEDNRRILAEVEVFRNRDAVTGNRQMVIRMPSRAAMTIPLKNFAASGSSPVESLSG